jgi:hypothetical protein
VETFFGRGKLVQALINIVPSCKVEYNSLRVMTDKDPTDTINGQDIIVSRYQMKIFRIVGFKIEEVHKLV